MDEFIRKIVDSLTSEGRRLSVVKNPDGFLSRPDTQQKVLNNSELLLLPITSSIELRVRYECIDRNSDNKVCYIISNDVNILPDMKLHLFNAQTFSLSKMMPACNETELRQARLTFDTASYIFNRKFTYNLSSIETNNLIKEAVRLVGVDVQAITAELRSISLEWEIPETMEKICHIILKAISQGVYHELEDVIDELNSNFQQFIDCKYFSLINSTAIKRPKMVHKILPFLSYKHKRTDRVTLIVIDGMSYWQYLILDKALINKGIQTKKDITFAWLPSITKLSRQAIFRGEAPTMEYSQSPVSEEKLWSNYWTSTKLNKQKQIQKFEINYTHGALSIEDSTFYRQAFVDVDLDNKMHSSTSNKDLFFLTQNWADETAESIYLLHKQGYQIYITADHGNVLANPWRALSSQEKTFLYDKESRGSRHLIYSKVNYLQEFLQLNSHIKNNLLIKDNWAVWRNRNCFKGKKEITHGGAHFLEVVIPFIIIEPK